jgi:hypothetical protein
VSNFSSTKMPPDVIESSASRGAEVANTAWEPLSGEELRLLEPSVSDVEGLLSPMPLSWNWLSSSGSESDYPPSIGSPLLGQRHGNLLLRSNITTPLGHINGPGCFFEPKDGGRRTCTRSQLVFELPRLQSHGSKSLSGLCQYIPLASSRELVLISPCFL